jgi:phosphopantothenoylcysteine decarboxylase/phosphopantothenate--cysteine ligase
LETENEIENAKEKLEKKNLDLIVPTLLQDEGACLVQINKSYLIDKNFNGSNGIETLC